MAKEPRKKKSILRRILKWTGITFLLLIIALILIPIFFKDEIKEMVIKEVNKSLTATLELDDFDLTFISTFPNLSIQLEGARLIGQGEFKDLKLADIKNVRADVGLWDVIGGDQIKIKAVHITEPTFNVKVLQSGLANYDIVKPDSLKTPEEVEEPSSFKMSLQEYSITGGKVVYNDLAGKMYAEIQNLNHSGEGDLTADVIDFKTKTTMDELTLDMDGMSYLSKVKSDFVVNLLMEFTETTSKFTLKENTLQLNALKFNIDGFYEMLADHDEMDLKLHAEQATFKEFLSLIPTFYQSGYESMIASGSLALKAEAKGKLDDVNLPAWDAGLTVKNASIKYPDLPGKISGITVIAGSKFAGGSNLDAMTIDVDKFHADFVGNTLDATLKMRNPMTDPLLKSGIQAKVNLATLGQVVPLAEGESYSGKLDADISIDGRMSALEREDYDAFKAEGTLLLKEMNYASKDLNKEVIIDELLFRFSPQNLSLEKLVGKTGNTDFSMAGKVDNYMAYVFKDELLKGNFTFNSNYIDLDELMNLVPASESDATTTTEAPSSESGEPLLIPANIDFDMMTSIGKMRYNGIDIKNLGGKVTLKDEIATLHNLNMDAMGGAIGLGGSYNTQNHEKPKVNFNYVLKELEIEQLAKNFLTIEKLAPIAKYAKGKISSSFTMSSDLTANLEPILSSLNGLGDLTSNSISISGFKPLDKISEVTKLKNLNNQTINNIKTKFKFEDGKMAFNPFDVVLGGIKTNVSGTTSLDQSINYDMKMIIPKEKIPAEMVKIVEQAAAKVNSLSPKLNISALPKELPINVNLIGTIMDPKVNTNFKEALMEASGNMKDALIDNIKETAKDTVKAIINDAKETVKENVAEQKAKIIAEAQKQSDKIKADAAKANASAKAEADKLYDKAVAEAGSNPLKKKAAEIAAKKVKDEAYKKADDAQAAANKKADDVLAKGKAEADKL